MHPFRECDSATAVTDRAPLAAPLAAIVLAAGLGTRMRSARAKVLHQLGGRPLLRYPLAAVGCLEPERIVVVVGHQADQVQEAAAASGLPGIRAVLQEEQRGTGHAVRCALPALDGLHGRRPHPLWRCPADPSGDVAPAGRGAPRTARASLAAHGAPGGSHRLRQDRARPRRPRAGHRRGARCHGRGEDDHRGQSGSLLRGRRIAATAAGRVARRQRAARVLPDRHRRPGGAGGSPGDHARERAAGRGGRHQHASGAGRHGDDAESSDRRALDGGGRDVRGSAHRIRRSRGGDRRAIP